MENEKQAPEENVEYNEEKFNTEMKNHMTDFNMGAQIYKKLKKSESITFVVAKEEIFRIACKVDYLSKMISKKGQLPIDELYNEVKNVFESVEALEKFIHSMVPIFLYIPGKQNPRNTSDGYRKLVSHIASLLMKQQEVTESNIDELIAELMPEDSKINRDTFSQHEFYLDFKGLRSLAAHVPCFNYNKNAKKIELKHSPDFENTLALWIEVLHPKSFLRRDISRQVCCNAVVTKIYQCYLKGRIIGCRKLSGYGAFILSKFLNGNKAGLEGFNVPAKTYVSVIGAVTPNDACQITVTTIAPTVIGWKMFDERDNWGDINDEKMIYNPNIVENPEDSVQDSSQLFTLPDIRTLCETYVRELLTKRYEEAVQTIGEDAVNFEDVGRQVKHQAKTSVHKFKTWKERRDRVLEAQESSKWNTKQLFCFGPEPTTFEMSSKMSEQLEEYMSDIGNK